MVTQPGTQLVNRETGELIETAGVSAEPQVLTITPQYIQQTQRSLALIQYLTRSVLVKDRDWGHVPGVAGDFLWDSGIQQVISAFNCHVGRRRILSLVDTDEKIAIVLEIPILSLQQLEVASGIGAASTMEVKNKYRWVRESELEVWGFNEDATKTLKKRVVGEEQVTEYRIPNPEKGELLNTLVKIASKRGELDAVQGLPGVAAALKEMFDWKAKKAAAEASPASKQQAPEQAGQKNKSGPDWNTFWAKTKQMGLESEIVHKMLGVKSMTEWTGHGFTLEQAIETVAKKLAASKVPGQQEEPTDPASIKTFEALYKATEKDFHLSKPETIKEAGYSNEKDIAEPPSEIYQRIKSMR